MWFWVYLAFLTALYVFGLRDDYVEGKHGVLWVSGTEGLVTVIGTLLWRASPPSEALRLAWRPVSVGLVVVGLAVAVIEVRGIYRDERDREPDLTARERFWTVFVGTALLFLFVVPAYWMNWRFAFG